MHKVLIVDDDPSGTQLLATLLKLEGFDAVPLDNWADPLQDIERQRPDMVIMDVRLRGKSGFELLAEIRQHPDPHLARTPVLIMSVDDHRLESEKAGAQGFVAKPFDLPTLLAAIAQVEEG